MSERLCDIIKSKRKEANLTLTKLAASLDIDQSTLSKIENKKRDIPYELIPKLSKSLDIELAYLEREFFSEIIAELIYTKDDYALLLELASDKIKYFRNKRVQQPNLKFNSQ